MYYGVYSVNCICMVTFIRSRLTYIYDINYYHLVYCYCLATLLPSTDVWQHVVKTIDRISNGNCLKTLTICPSLSPTITTNVSLFTLCLCSNDAFHPAATRVAFLSLRCHILNLEQISTETTSKGTHTSIHTLTGTRKFLSQ